MQNTYLQETQNLENIVDFLRFALSRAMEAHLYYGHGTDNAADDMRALILGSLSLPHDLDPLLLNSRLTAIEKNYLCDQLHKRIHDQVPVPYLTREAFFCGLPFYVDERVLIPRSPMAELIQHQFSPWIIADQVDNILDLCTGSACIAIACCFAFPEAAVDAVDICADALEVAEINREHYHLEEQLTLIKSDCFSAVSDLKYDLIVSNPPYVGFDEMQSLPKEYAHEPTLALEAENNGLALVERILHEAHNHLSDIGILVVEVGNSDEALVEAYPDLPFTWLEFENGGHGVFLLTYQQLHTYFAS
jgi:ribosomal protein L3 glutamine methyltransferase